LGFVCYSIEMKMRALLIFILAIFTQLSSASTALAWSGCDCSDYHRPDPSSCPKAPLRLSEKRNCYVIGNPHGYCSPPGSEFPTISTIAKSEKFRDLTYDVSTNPDGKHSKGLIELLDYMSCYREEHHHDHESKAPDFSSYCSFKKYMAPDILLAAESSKALPAVVACRYMQESSFNPNAQSHAEPEHAYGMDQFLPSTAKAMTKIIQEKHPEEWKKNLSKAQDHLKRIREELLSATGEKKLALTKDLNGEKYEIREMGAMLAARAVWDNAWQGTKNPPKHITGGPNGSGSCSHVAFIAGEMYHQFGLYESGLFDLKEKDHLIVADGMDAFDTGILSAGIYNNGEGKFAHHCRGIKSVPECERRYPVTHETRNHMESISNCAAQGDFNALNGKKALACGKETKCSL
jgi:hypothetical protein